MTRKCDNCGQAVLASDAVCWHCGRELTPVDAGEQVEAETAVPDESDRPLSLTAAALFALLTVLTILLFFGVTHALSQYPVVAVDPGAPIKPGWTPLIDHRSRFTVDVPPDWSWTEDVVGAEMAVLDELLADNPAYGLALAPLATAVPDTRVRLLAALSRPPGTGDVDGFLVVGESEWLTRLTPAQMQALLVRGGEAVTVVETGAAQDLQKREMVTAVIRFTTGGQTWECSQHIFQGETANYITAVCQPDDRKRGVSSALTNILSSFQLLGR